MHKRPEHRRKPTPSNSVTFAWMAGSSSWEGVPIAEAAEDRLAGAEYADTLRRTAWTPEQSLAAAVLWQATEDLARGGDLAVDAAAWFLDRRESRWPHSFVAVCAMFGFDAERFCADLGAKLSMVERPRYVPRLRTVGCVSISKSSKKPTERRAARLVVRTSMRAG